MEPTNQATKAVKLLNLFQLYSESTDMISITLCYVETAAGGERVNN